MGAFPTTLANKTRVSLEQEAEFVVILITAGELQGIVPGLKHSPLKIVLAALAVARVLAVDAGPRSFMATSRLPTLSVVVAYTFG